MDPKKKMNMVEDSTPVSRVRDLDYGMCTTLLKVWTMPTAEHHLVTCWKCNTLMSKGYSNL